MGLLALAFAANALPAQAASRPDLVVSSISAPTTKTAGQVLTVTSTVKNRGTARAASSRVRTWLSTDTTPGNTGDKLLGTRYVTALAAGRYATGKTSYTLPTTIRKGRWNLIVCADATRLVRESVETNNCRVRAFTVNRPPVANNDVVSTNEDTPKVIGAATLLANDTDPDPVKTLAITGVTSGAGGTAALSGSTITFTPAANRVTPATFTYTARDSLGLTDTAVVTVNLFAVNDAPVAVDDQGVTQYQAQMIMPASTLLANDITVDDAETLTVTQVFGQDHGTVLLNNDVVSFTPEAGYSGTAGFDYTVSDGVFNDSGHVTITVGSPNTIVTSVGSLVLGESGNTVVGVKLGAEPQANVTVTVTSSDTTAFTASPATLTFTPLNWDTNQTVTLAGVADLDLVNESGTLSLTSPAATTKQVTVTVNDDDTQAIVVSPASPLWIYEGSSDSVTVRLAFQPASNVTVSISSAHTPTATVSTSSLSFTPANYAVGQSVTINGVSDVDFTHDSTTITFSAPGGIVLNYSVTVEDEGPCPAC